MLDTLFQALESAGYPVVFAAAMLENIFLVGMFVPGQAVVLGAGLASRFGELDPLWVAAVAAIGELVGNAVSLVAGRYAGGPLLDKRAEWLEGRGVDLEKARGFVDRHGAKALVLGRPAWGLKNVIPVLVGASGMPLGKALGYVALASAVYYPALVGLGYLLGLGFEEAARFATWLGIAVAAVVVVLAFVGWRALKKSRDDST